MPEKRGSLRLPVNLEAHFDHADKGYDGRILNISEEGVFLKSPRLFDPEDEIELSFQLPGRSGPLKVQGKVAWGGTIEGEGLTTFGLGVHFEDLPPSIQEDIDLFIRHLLKA